MPTDTKLNNLVINYLTQAQYDAIATKNENELYLTPDNSTGGVSPTLILMGDNGVRTTLTEEEVNNINNFFYNTVYYNDPSFGASQEYNQYILCTFLPWYKTFLTYKTEIDYNSGSLHIVSLVMYTLVIGEKNESGEYPISITNEGEVSIEALISKVGYMASLPYPERFNSEDGKNILLTLGNSTAYAGLVDTNLGRNGTVSVIYGINNNVTGDATLCKMLGLFADGSGLGVAEFKKGSNGNPDFKSFTTWLPPVTSADEGKSLVIKNGNAQWTDLTSIHQHTIVIKEGSKIIFAANKDLASATPATTLETLISTFKGTTTAGFGDYILLTVDTTAKLTKQDGTETDLSTLTVTISDTVK